jgi:hypothetical protein
MKEKPYRISGFLYIRAKKEASTHKTAMLVSSDILPEGLPQEEFEKELNQKTGEILGSRPIDRYGSPAKTPRKRPASVFTPGGTELSREKDYGLAIIYSNGDKLEAVRNPILDAKTSHILKETSADPKEQEIVLTSELIKKMDKQIRLKKRGSKGIPDQNQTMVKKGVNKQKASATKIAELLGVKEKFELWEWLHLIAFMFRGANAQEPTNMSGGTKDANTDMIFAEDAVRYLAYVQEKEVRLIVKSFEYPGTHFAKEIHYTVITKEFTLPFIFNAQTSIQPGRRNSSYIQSLVDTLISQTSSLCSGQARRELKFQEPKVSSEPTMPLFFPKPKPQTSSQEPVTKKYRPDMDDNTNKETDVFRLPGCIRKGSS